jgi:tRNA (guanine9-N1)-methyltransferase
MDAEERPTKLRKLSTGQASPVKNESNGGSLLSGSVGIPPSSSNDKSARPNDEPEDDAAIITSPSEQVQISQNSNELRKPNPQEHQRPKRQPDPDPALHERRLLAHDPSNPSSGPPLSKNQQKKLRKREEWEAGRSDRKLKRKEKTKEKKARKRERWNEEREQLKRLNGDDDDDDGTEVRNGGDGKVKASKAKRNAAKAKQKHQLLPITILIDCGYDDLMLSKERISLGSQLTRSYSDNSRAPYQAHLVITSWGGELKQRFDTVLTGTYRNWRGVRFQEPGWKDVVGECERRMRGLGGGRLIGPFEKYAVKAEDGRDRPNGDTGAGETRDPVSQSKHSGHSQTPVSNTTSPSEGQPPQPSVNGSSTTSQPEQPDRSTSIIDEPADDSTVSNSTPKPAQRPPNSSTPTDARSQQPPPTSPELQGEVVYLTSDSPHTLSRLNPYSTYVIGGLVDKNRHKGICYKSAMSTITPTSTSNTPSSLPPPNIHVKTAKLPISKYMSMTSRQVLATNHVVEILLRWMEEVVEGGEDGAWGRAFMRVLPKRKDAKLKNRENGQTEQKTETDDGEAEEDGREGDKIEGKGNDVDDEDEAEDRSEDSDEDMGEGGVPLSKDEQ